MKIDQLHLLNFRNFTGSSFHFHPRVNILVGQNGAGKTNVVESIYFLSALRSFRLPNEKGLIQNQKPFARIACDMDSGRGQDRLSLLLSLQGKSIQVNGQVLSRTSSFIGLLNTVLFSPGDLSFFDNSPRLRRRFLDLELSKLSKTYLDQVTLFSDFLKQRNVLLKSKPDPILFDYISQKMIESQYEIFRWRSAMVEFFNQKIGSYFDQMSHDPIRLSFVYQTDGQGQNKEDFIREMKIKLDRSRERDEAFKMTHVGLHRDDFQAYVGQDLMDHILSQGQKRLVLIAMKLALSDYIYQISKERPILLLDDVMSELDHIHQKQLLSMCLKEDCQIVITTTGVHQKMIPIQHAHYFHIDKGQISKGEYHE